MKTFPSNLPVACHAEKQTLAAVLTAAYMSDRHGNIHYYYVIKKCSILVHICHLSSAQEMELVKLAKQRGLKITCEVCPHHLFLTSEDLPLGYREVRPCLSNSKADCDFLWENIEYIDCFATDHGKFKSEN